MNVAVVLDSLPHSSVAVNSTVASPVAPHKSERPSKLLDHTISEQSSEAAALLYGGNASDYVTSTDPNSINNLAWVSTWGGPCAQHSQDYKLDEGNPGYNDPDPGVGLAASAYVQDHCYEASHINYVWRVNGGNGLCELSDLCGATGALTVEFTATDSCGNHAFNCCVLP